MVEPTQLEAMLTHLLNERGPNGRPWVAITVPGYPKFTVADVVLQLHKIRHEHRWWQFWK